MHLSGSLALWVLVSFLAVAEAGLGFAASIMHLDSPALADSDSRLVTKIWLVESVVCNLSIS
jgi:hypothetical protein